MTSEHAPNDAAAVAAEVRTGPWSDVEVRSLLDALPVCVSYVDKNERYRFNNATYTRWFGTPTERIKGKHVAEVLGPAAYEGIRPRIEAALAGEHVAFEEAIPYEGGGTRWVLAEYIPRRSGDGSVAGFYALVRDITERKRAEQAVLDVHAALRRIHSITSDPELDFERRLHAFLELGRERFGLPVGIMARVEGDDYRVVSVRDPSGRLQEGVHYALDHTYCSETIRRDEPLHFDNVVHSDLQGHPCFERTRLQAYIGVPIRVRGRVYGTLSFCGEDPRPEPFTRTDDEIVKLMAEWMGAEIQRADDQSRLQQAEKMEAIGRLASGVAHDFNNVLMGIIGTADLALDRLPEHAEGRELLVRIKDAASAGASISRQLLDFGRRGEGEPSAAPIDAVVAETQHMLEHLVGEHVELRVELGAEAVWVACDRGRIQQILMNLVANARDAVSGGGRITIATATTGLDTGRDDSEPGGGCAVLRVSDTGHGLDEATLARVFEPFFTTKQAGEGTGLGLATVYAIARRSGGHAEIRSDVGRGTTVEVHLPCAGRPAGSLAGEAVRPEAVEAATVLVVEDQRLVREAVKSYLEKAGYDVLAAESGAQALALCGEVKVDVLLTDVMLPGMQGDRLVREVRALQPDAAAVYMSARAADQLVRDGRLAPDARVLQKPFTRPELLAAVHEARVRRTARAEHTARRDATILLVEDHEVVRHALRKLLEGEGYRVIEACTGERALGLVDRATLMVADLGLPDMDGLALAREARGRRECLPVLFLSGRHPDSTEARRLLGEARTAYLTKPVEIGELLERLQGLLAT